MNLGVVLLLIWKEKEYLGPGQSKEENKCNIQDKDKGWFMCFVYTCWSGLSMIGSQEIV